MLAHTERISFIPFNMRAMGFASAEGNSVCNNSSDWVSQPIVPWVPPFQADSYCVKQIIVKQS